MRNSLWCCYRWLIKSSLLLRRFDFHMAEASAKREWLVMNRKGPWEGYRRAGEATSRPLSPSRLPLRAHFHRKRDVWVRGRIKSIALKKCKKNAMLLKLFCYKVFVHCKLKLLNFLFRLKSPFWKVMFKQKHTRTFNPLKNLLVRDKGVLFWPNRSLLRTFLPPYWISAVTSWKGQYNRNLTSYFKNFTCVTFISHVAGYSCMIPEFRYTHLIPWILEKFKVALNRLNRNLRRRRKVHIDFQS